jgi:hypothetical protein
MSKIELPPDEELLRRAAKAFKRPVTRGGVPRWSAVGWLFGLGSTYATHLCRRLGLDPDEMVRKP